MEVNPPFLVSHFRETSLCCGVIAEGDDDIVIRASEMGRNRKLTRGLGGGAHRRNPPSLARPISYIILAGKQSQVLGT
jgi:hypothetical protein